MSDDFKTEFLAHYLSVGMGALGKKDIDALVMHLLDKYGTADSAPLCTYPNQEVSALLKTPATKIRSLRYEAGLKFGGRVEDQAKVKLLIALSRAVLELESKKICLVIEDALAKNWLQGQLKNNGLIFDHSFNTEIIKVEAKGLFELLTQFFDTEQTARFKEAFERISHEKNNEEQRKEFIKITKNFALKLAEKAGSGILTSIKLHLGIP